jgi:hypothetical protein
MHDAVAIGQFERRLVELGCPAARLREKVRELAEHYQDLKEAALEEGLTEAEAEARAEAELGDAVLLAEETLAVLRQASWWGRHPALGFCFLPLLAFWPAWVCCAGALTGTCWLLGRLFGPTYQFDDNAVQAVKANPELFEGFVRPTNEVLTFSAILLMALVFCWLARRAAVGMKWMATACLVCALDGVVNYADIVPGLVTFGFILLSPFWYGAILPLSVAAAALVRQKRTANRLAPIPAGRRAMARQEVRRTMARSRSVFWMPTYWLMALLGTAVLACVVFVEVMSAQDAAESLHLKSTVWPAERAATLQQLSARQAAIDCANPILIDLKARVNARLLATVDGVAGARENNLAELPSGVHAFAGVPFDVQGRIQLLGKRLLESGRRFPAEVKYISIGRRCARIHLLHGASAARNLNEKIARLVLHYQDGSQAEIGIVTGADVLDWWGPIYNTEAGEERNPTSAGTELAWAGSNPWIKHRAPELSLRLYRSSFANPHPDREIASMDYVSTLSEAAPFLLGLTLE